MGYRITADRLRKQRMKNERRQREAQNREVQRLDRKHLQGMRVVQKSLIYITGLVAQSNLKTQREIDDMEKTLRGHQYLGQYGEIRKILLSPGKEVAGYGVQGMGVYVTFVRKEDAEQCMKALDGTENNGRLLR
jgi:CCR4-NOT transcription complex subunit 4